VGAARNLKNRQFAVWALFIPVYALSVAIFFVSSRYRLPLLIPMCITSGAMFVRPRVWHWIVVFVLLLLLFGGRYVFVVALACVILEGYPGVRVGFIVGLACPILAAMGEGFYEAAMIGNKKQIPD